MTAMCRCKNLKARRAPAVLSGCASACVFVAMFLPRAPASAADELFAGAATADITPPAGLPMWGYGGRKDIPATGTRDRLEAYGVVLRAGAERLAIVGMDLGRPPARATIAAIRRAVREEIGVENVLLNATHTHHGPCPELEGRGATGEYLDGLREMLTRLIIEAAGNERPAKIAAASKAVRWNRNRHSKVEPVPLDDLLQVVRIDDLDGKRIATLVNFAAHPTTLPAELLEWSADFPGALRRKVEKEAGGVCVFLQGASGDLSTHRDGLDTDAYGARLADDVLALAAETTPRVPPEPEIDFREEEFRFEMRFDIEHPATYLKFVLAFFKDLVDAYVKEYQNGVRPTLSVALLNREIGIVGVSGEVFSSHAIRLRERARLPHLLFLGCTNGYHQYFPTIEAVHEGGYGADPDVSPVAVGAGERMMDRALFHLYDLREPIRGAVVGGDENE